LQAASPLQRLSTDETDRKERKSQLAVSQVIPVTQKLEPTPNSPPTCAPLEKCPECGTPLGGPMKGAEQKRTVTDIPLPDHIIYEIVYPGYWCGECKKLVRGEAPWLPPNQHFGPAVACRTRYQRMLGLTIGMIQPGFIGDVWSYYLVNPRFLSWRSG